MTTSLKRYVPFEWLQCPNVYVPGIGELPKAPLLLGARTSLDFAIDAKTVRSTDNVPLNATQYTLPEFCFRIELDAKSSPYTVVKAWIKAERNLLKGLFPKARPKDLCISHRGGWDVSTPGPFSGNNVHSLMVSIARLQPY